jgi:hypothetical protein
MSAHPKSHLMSRPPVDDPVLKRFRAALDALYDNRIEHGWRGVVIKSNI